MRRGLGKGMGKGYRNIIGRDPRVHSDSARGRKQPQKVNLNRFDIPRRVTEKGRIVNEGVGGFLEPPGHPSHNFSVEYDLIRRPQNRGSSSLEYALKSDWLDMETKRKAKKLLDDYEKTKPKLESPEIQDWIEQVMGYFRNCYQGANGSWDASELVCDSKIDPIKNQDSHAGVHFIRKHYPNFKLKKEHLDKAYWGTKPKPEGAL